MPDRSIEHRTKVPEIRKGDTVVVLAGKDAGKRGKVDQVIRRDPSPSPVRSGYRRTSLDADRRSGRHPRSRDAAPGQQGHGRLRPLRPPDASRSPDAR
jgi:hypothetical protein